MAQGKDGVPAFDIDLSFMRGVRDRVNLARRVEKGLHTLRKINEGNVRILAVVACPGGGLWRRPLCFPTHFRSPHLTRLPPPPPPLSRSQSWFAQQAAAADMVLDDLLVDDDDEDKERRITETKQEVGALKAQVLPTRYL